MCFPPVVGERVHMLVMYMYCCGIDTLVLGAAHIAQLIFSFPSMTANPSLQPLVEH